MTLRCLTAWALVLVLAGCGRLDFAAFDADLDGSAQLAVTSTYVERFDTTGATPVEIPGTELTIPPSPGTRWLLLTSAVLESTTFSGVAAEAFYLIDGVERGMGGTANSAAMRPGPWQHFDVIEGDTSSHVVSYRLHDASGGTATILALRAVAIPLRADAVAFASSDPPQDVTAPDTAPLQIPLALGALDGDHIFMLLVNTSEAPASSSIFTTWSGPAGEVWMPSTHNPRGPWQALFMMQRANINSANAIVTLNAWVGGPGPSRVQYVRAIAIRADAFTSLEFARDDNNVVTSSPVLATGVAIDTAPSTASSYLLVGSVRLREDCSALPDADRAAYVVADALQIAFAHETDNCAYTTTYGHVVPLSSRPAHVEVAYSSGNALPVVYNGSQVLLLGLR